MPQWFTDLTTSQKWAAYRHYITFAAGALAALGILSATQDQALLSGLNDVFDGLAKIVGGVVTICTVLAPIYNGWKASHNAGKKIGDVVSDPSQLDSPAAKAAVISAAAMMPEVKGISLDKQQPQAAALNAATPPNVTAS